LNEEHNAALEEMRANFIRNSAKRLDDIERLTDVLAADAADRTSLDQLMRKLHGLAGLGTTFGFPAITSIARAAEIDATHLLESASAPGATHLGGFRSAITRLREQLAAGGLQPHDAWSSAHAPHAAAAGTDVVLLEDDPIGHRIAVRVLEKQGMTVRGAFTKAEAVKLLDDKIPDALITDILVPDGTGYELIADLRARPGGTLAPAIITSGLQGFLDKVEAVRCGADGFFEKPIDFGALTRTLDNLLARVREEAPRVLAVIGDADTSAFAESVLESAGYRVRMVDSPQQFESNLEAFSPDLVLIAAELPTISGLELVRYVRQKRSYEPLPVLILGDDDVTSRVASLRAGADDHLAAELSPQLLLAAIESRVVRGKLVRNLVDHDGLTNLLTHSAFMRQLTDAWSALQNEARAASLVMLDLDRFKIVNDTWGHPIGDRVLTSLAALLRKRIRRSDDVARYGGEEFAILLNDLGAEESARFIESIREEFATMVHTDDEGRTFRVTFSAGIAQVDDAMAHVEQWKLAADQALYAAKHAGRNCVKTSGS
jgi:diguanylate cyclase (GGDEF)-like protein